MSDLDDTAPLSAEDILTFGPVVESQTWEVTWLAEARAPIAVAAGKPKLGRVFDDDGRGKAVIIRPCVSRGRRVRGLSPIYTQEMLKANAAVFSGWPQYMDHVPAELAEKVARRGRSVRELGGQILTSFWDADHVAEEDEAFGYQKGGVLAEVWANPVIRQIVGNNPNLLHNSISAWPTSGKPGKAPWNQAVKGMVIEGIRRQPQGSVDYVPRGGAGGRLQLAEGESPDTAAWPEPQWRDEDRTLVVSLAEAWLDGAEVSRADGTYGSGTMDFSKMKPEELRQWVQENAPNLLPALAEAAPASGAPQPPAAAAPTGAAALTEADVTRIVAEAMKGQKTLTPDEVRNLVQEQVDDLSDEREGQRRLSSVAHDLIESARGVPAGWKADLKARYSLTPDGVPPALLVEAVSADEAEDGKALSEEDVLKGRVLADLDHARNRIAEAQGKPRVTGEGAGTKKLAGDDRPAAIQEGEVPYWRQSFAELGVVESADDALTIHGVTKKKVEG